MNRAWELDPLSPYAHIGTVWPVFFSRRYDEAIDKFKKVVELNPESQNANVNLGWAFTAKGLRQEAVAAYEKALSGGNLWIASASLAATLARMGRTADARKILAELLEQSRHEHVSDYGFAMVYAGLGEKEQALAALQKAFDERDEYTPYINVDPFFDSLRHDPRFTDLLRRMNLAP